MKFKDYMGRQLNVEAFVYSSLNGNDYDRGELEALNASSSNLLNSISRLMQILADKKILNRDEVHFIATGYKDE